MDDETTISSLKLKIQQFCEERDWAQFHGPKDLAIAIVTEASELLEHFRFKDAAQIKALFENPTKREAISEELADVVMLALRFSELNKIDLTEAINKKMEINAKKYPVEKAKGNNSKYDELK